MAKTLGGVSLPESIFWRNRWQKIGRIFTPLVDISGATNTTFVVEQAVNTTGRAIELVCESDAGSTFNGFFFNTGVLYPEFSGTKCTVHSIQTLADTGGDLALVWDSETYTVRFSEYPTFEPVVWYSTVTDEKYNLYTGALQLVTV